MSGTAAPWDFPPDLYLLHNCDGDHGFPKDPIRMAEVERLFAEHNERQRSFSEAIAAVKIKAEKH